MRDTADFTWDTVLELSNAIIRLGDAARGTAVIFDEWNRVMVVYTPAERYDTRPPGHPGPFFPRRLGTHKRRKR